MNDMLGRVIAGRYRVDAFLGKGGMAEVYKVWDQNRSVFLAMKVLHSDLAEDKVFLRRFRREAQTLAKLQHPNIVRFYSMEQDGDMVFILMDYIEGITLRKEIFQAKQPFTYQRILEIMTPVCSALFYAHKSGFVHCDIKPANIMINSNGTVAVSDFGIARMTESATATLVGAGTPAYMAPEQARGESPTPQMDIYALGVILYEMLTGGERPFTGESARTTGSTSEKIIWEQLNLDPPPLRKFIPNISPKVEEVVNKCLSKEPAKRFASVNDFLTELTRAFSPDPVVLPVSNNFTLPNHTGEGTQNQQPRQQSKEEKMPAQSNSFIRGLLVGIAAALVVGVIGFILFSLGRMSAVPSGGPALSSPLPSASMVQAQNQMATYVAQTLAAQQPTATNTLILPSATPTPLYLKANVKASMLHLHMGPDTRFEDVPGSNGYPNGESMIITGKDQTGQWFEVKAPDGTTGWAYIQWLDLPPDYASIPTASSIPSTPTLTCVYIGGPWGSGPWGNPNWSCH